MWDLSATFALCIKANGLATFFIPPKNCIFWGASFEPIKKWQVCSLKSYKVLMKTFYTIVTPYQSHLGWHFRNLKAQGLNVSFSTFQWKETFELCALSFETAFENVTPSGIGCTSKGIFYIIDWVGRRVSGLGQITWWIVCWQKLRGHIWKKLYENREIVVARTVGVWEHTNSCLGAQIGSVLKPIQTLKKYFWSHVYCAQLGTPWHQIVGVSRTVFNRESLYPRRADSCMATNDESGSQPKLFARMVWFQGVYPSNGILRKKIMTGNNIFKKFPSACFWCNFSYKHKSCPHLPNP